MRVVIRGVGLICLGLVAIAPVPALFTDAWAGGGELEIFGETSMSPQELQHERWQEFDRVECPGFVNDAPSGYPELPRRGLYYLIPDGYRVDEVEVLARERQVLPGSYHLLPGRSAGWEEEGISPAPGVYERMSEYPGNPVTLGYQGFWRGSRVACVVYQPVGYLPAAGELVVYPRVEYRLRLVPDAGETGLGQLRSRAAVLETHETQIAEQVENAPLTWEDQPGLGDGSSLLFAPSEYPSLDGSMVEYVIITSDELAPHFQDLVDWRTQCGLPGVVRTVSWIEQRYPEGVDRGERIRRFIQEAYEKWGTNYVLLGGDTDVIPVRLAHCQYYEMPEGEDIPTDLYYSCLDGPWDGDQDGLFGEGFDTIGFTFGDSVDLYPDVFVGRAPVETAVEVQTFVDKTLRYETDPDPGYQNKGLFVAEVLFPYDWDPGDPIWTNGCDLAHEAGVWVPGTWDTLYLCEYPHGNENRAAVLAALNQGYHLVNIVSHGDAFRISTSDRQYIYIDDVMGLTNSDRLSLYYYSNCQTSQLEAESINEAFMLNAGGGAVGCVAPTRLDFPDIARWYQTRFYELFFASDLRRLGELSEYHRAPWAGVVNTDGQHRWTHLTLLLFGDPALPVYKALPESLEVTHTGTFTLGDSTYAVTVSHASVGVPGAQVVLWKQDTNEYSRALTDNSGIAYLDFRPEALGGAILTVTKADYLPSVDSVSVVAGAPLVYVSNVVVDDDSTGSSLGNGDGVFDAGEKVELEVTLTNGSGSTATAVGADLALREGSTVTFDCYMNLAQQPDRVFLGAGGAGADTLPVTLPLGGPYITVAGDSTVPRDTIDTWGRPHFNAFAVTDTGCYVWEDASGWHVRLVGGGVDVGFIGSVDTDGAFAVAQPYGMEPGDNFTPGETTITFFSSVDSSEFEDGLDCVVQDSTWVTLIDSVETYGDIPHGSSVTRTFVVEAGSGAPDHGPARFDLTISSGALAVPISWPEGVSVDLAAPSLADYFHQFDDSSYGGNGNGVWENGETAGIRSYVRNGGTGSAEEVTAVMRDIIGVTMVDSTASYGTVPGGSVVEAGDDIVATSYFPALMSVEMELTDAWGRAWAETLDLAFPAAPESLRDIPSPLPEEVAVDIVWAPVDENDIWGYHVYRSPASGGGHTLLNGGMVELSAYYHDTDVVPGSTYYYMVTAIDSSGNESPPSTELAAAVRPPFQGSWPQNTLNAIWSSPVVMDLDEDGDGDLEVLVGSKDGRLYCWDQAGNLMPGWPQATGGEIWSSPVVGQLDGDAPFELVIGSSDTKVYAFNHDGVGLLSPDGVFADVAGDVRSTPTLGDLDGDGDLEVLVGTMNGRLYAWDHDGTGHISPDGIFAYPGGAFAASPSLADLDGNGDLEVIIPNHNAGKVYVWNHDGSGFMNPDGTFVTPSTYLWASAAVGDVNDNGVQDIVVAGRNGRVYVYDRWASLLSGWPRITGDEIWGSPALGDLNGDSRLEVVVGSYDRNVYVWDYQGNLLPGWPQATGDSIWASPSLADLSGDGVPEVVVGNDEGLLYAWDALGNHLPGWPQRVAGRIFNSGAAIADLDFDGDVEVVVGCYDSRVYVWDLPTPWNPLPSASPWPMFCHDTYRTGWYNSPLTDVADGGGESRGIPTRYALGQNRPNPFNPVTEISYQLAATGAVALTVYDVAGRVVRELVREEQPAGYYRLRWDGRDDDGQQAASGVYFYRLETESGNWSRKMVLMK